ncbi:hypothetical protein DZG01_02820 [Pseudomonas fluorescens]|nr:hypothetical protein DZG01_02820 [Pseudomonas fluorescens]
MTAELFTSNGNIKNPCGSEPARDSGGSVNTTLADPPLSRAGSLPQGGRWCIEDYLDVLRRSAASFSAR